MDTANAKLMKAQTDNLNAQTALLLAQAEELNIRNRENSPPSRRKPKSN